MIETIRDFFSLWTVYEPLGAYISRDVAFFLQHKLLIRTYVGRKPPRPWRVIPAVLISHMDMADEIRIIMRVLAATHQQADKLLTEIYSELWFSPRDTIFVHKTADIRRIYSTPVAAWGSPTIYAATISMSVV